VRFCNTRYMVRPKTQILSRRIILDAALEQINRHHDFTIIGIAKVLGVNPSSLYHHVTGGKDEIIDGLRERIYQESDFRPFANLEQDWQSELGAWVRTCRAAIAKFPAAIPLLMGRAVDDEPTLAVYEHLASILALAQVPADKQIAVISLLDALILGSAVDAFSPAPAWITNSEQQPALHRAVSSSTADRVDAALEMGIDAVTNYIEHFASTPLPDHAPTSRR